MKTFIFECSTATCFDCVQKSLFQVKVALVTAEIIELPKTKIIESVPNAVTGKCDNKLEGDRAESLLRLIYNPGAA